MTQDRALEETLRQFSLSLKWVVHVLSLDQVFSEQKQHTKISKYIIYIQRHLFLYKTEASDSYAHKCTVCLEVWAANLNSTLCIFSFTFLG